MTPRLIIATALFVGLAAGASAQSTDANHPIRAGYAATSNDGHTRILLDAGFNSQLLSSRLSPMFTLALNESGDVVRVGIDAQKEKSFRDYVARCAELGLDLYIGTAYRKVHAEQLEALGPISHAVVQGPRRYLSSGVRGVPSPLERKYWMGQLLQEALYIAELAKTYPNIRGFNFDLEAYAENVMWRHNSSFDDQTFFAAIAQMQEAHGSELMVAAKRVPFEKRYDWLAEYDLLKDYFDAQSQLITQLAIEFRKRVREVNPDLELGFVYYEPNWMHDGWARGLGTADKPCVIFSELEYHHGIGPSSRGLAQRLKDMGLYARYLPGLQPEHFTPGQFARAAADANYWHNGYWMFTSYSLWQPKPEKLWGPYTLLAAADQYISALGSVNQQDYQHPQAKGKSTLLTGNAFYEGEKADVLPKVDYSRQPDVLYCDDPQGTKLFDGIEVVAPGAVVWYATAGESLIVDIDLTRVVDLDRLRLRVGHGLPEHPSLKQGKLRIETSTDAKHFYPLMKDIANPGLINRGIIVADDLGIQVRYLRLTMITEEVQPFGVWGLSEIAMWGWEQGEE